MKLTYAAIALLSSAFLSGCTPHVNLNTPFGSRPPNSHELFYTYTAAQFGDARLCDKISRRAIDESGPDLGITQWRVHGQRSACYFYVALQTKDERLCDSVSSVVTLPSNASEISGTKCRQFVHLPSHSGPTAQYYVPPELLKEMGYTDEDRYAAEYAENPINSSIGHFYETIWNTEPFKLKVRILPSYDEPYSVEKMRPANGDEILTAQLAARDSIPELCTKISPNSYEEGPKDLRWRVPLKLALRNSCFFNVAQSSGKSSFCKKIMPLDKTMNGVRTAAPNDCESQVKIQARDKSLAFHPGVSFSTMKPFAEELRKLGYPDPFVIDERTMDWSHFYLHVLFQAPQETKTEFLRKAANLPSFKK